MSVFSHIVCCINLSENPDDMLTFDVWGNEQQGVKLTDVNGVTRGVMSDDFTLKNDIYDDLSFNEYVETLNPYEKELVVILRENTTTQKEKDENESSYMEDLKLFLTMFNHIKNVDDLNGYEINDFMRRQLAEGKSVSTALRRLSSTRNFLIFLKKEGK